MKSPISRKFTAIVGPIMGAALSKRFEGRAGAKRLAYEVGSSEDTARIMLSGQVPHGEYLLASFARFGWTYIRELLEPIAGEMPTQAEIAEVAVMRRSLDEVVPLPVLGAASVALASRPGSASSEQGGLDRDEGGVGQSLVVTRRSLAVVAGRKSHLATYLRRWSESLGLAERSSLVSMAHATPQHRTSLVTQRGEDLIYGHISPAFRLHAPDREKLIGRPTTDTFDKDYAEACAQNTRAVIASGKPAVDDVRARVKVEPGVYLDLTYRRLILPYLEGGVRFAVCASEPIAGTA